MKSKKSKVLFWLPRILTFLFIGFLSLFSLDVFVPGYTIWQVLQGFFMHNLPSLFLIIVLLISWRHEIIGGVIFLLLGIVTAFFTYSLVVSVPCFLIGFLFLLSRFKK